MSQFINPFKRFRKQIKAAYPHYNKFELDCSSWLAYRVWKISNTNTDGYCRLMSNPGFLFPGMKNTIGKNYKRYIENLQKINIISYDTSPWSKTDHQCIGYKNCDNISYIPSAATCQSFSVVDPEQSFKNWSKKGRKNLVELWNNAKKESSKKALESYIGNDPQIKENMEFQLPGLIEEHKRITNEDITDNFKTDKFGARFFLNHNINKEEKKLWLDKEGNPCYEIDFRVFFPSIFVQLYGTEAEKDLFVNMMYNGDFYGSVLEEVKNISDKEYTRKQIKKQVNAWLNSEGNIDWYPNIKQALINLGFNNLVFQHNNSFLEKGSFYQMCALYEKTIKHHQQAGIYTYFTRLGIKVIKDEHDGFLLDAGNIDSLKDGLIKTIERFFPMYGKGPHILSVIKINIPKNIDVDSIVDNDCYSHQELKEEEEEEEEDKEEGRGTLPLCSSATLAPGFVCYIKEKNLVNRKLFPVRINRC